MQTGLVAERIEQCLYSVKIPGRRVAHTAQLVTIFGTWSVHSERMPAVDPTRFPSSDVVTL